MWAMSAVGCRRWGTAGAAAIAVGGWFAGALPARDPWGIWVRHGSLVTGAGTVLAYAGLSVLVVAWWRYGKAGAGVRDTLVTLAWWVAPLLLAPPLYSADVYSYIAQGAMVLEGHDVYTAGPSVVDPAGLGGDAAASVGGNWTDTPAPYGPFFLILARAVAWTAGGAIVPAVLGMRLLALGALVLMVWGLRHLARHLGRSESAALRFGALNPLLLMHVVGGMHNDGLMIGLLLAGVVFALRGRWIAGSALIGLALMIKSPAALALLFIGVLVGRAASGPLVRRTAKGLLAPGLIAGAVAVAVTLIAGTGFGWLRTQGVAAGIHTPLSATSDLGLALGTLLHVLVGTDPDPVTGAVRTLGLVAALAVIAHLGWRAARGRVEPVHALGLALLALVALSPMVQPWYLLWGMTVIAATTWNGRAGTVVAVLSAALAYETVPKGATPPFAFVLVGVVCVIGTLVVRRERTASPGEARLPGQRRAVNDGARAADGVVGAAGGS
ncbi:polyprenol phosphomannose-dependent alpha 1,6 mannosyltransferase MptB [Streptomyces liangshanensis]|uniref:Polyprenol phosphomannose-dependent alpha 1,6 mannosyltransferase MptB n=1 Tax=Streptomyces liangshanensis TaxID=2717324 RepID=A0A6G9GS78_9ACTN|nr:polyprenol phosphomannose-dependent alpha 1,6 mannosyltransferase MptB [Streptomyces liangshanensis]QIQ00929.1 polyprenol phosphomannose-dependent alpha 1,6 mannosyltransferase MptB [Streptomyces liangshanensis]